MNSTIFIQQNPFQVQIDTFIALVNEVNQIPNITISLNEENDLQRDALAFLVDTIYRQFKNENWPQMMKQLPLKIKDWNTPRNSFKATSSLLKFIQHLVDYRIIEMLKTPELSDSNKEYIKTLHNLYQVSTASILKNAQPDSAVFFGGISKSLLPEWYLRKLYKPV
ncbi:MAG: hypothetical protein H0X29_00450 [Parachlamydiaceae bacterium]|nr:hypothetical protein [Parachlamydiaceae bacterium]